MKYQLVIFDFDGTLADTFPWLLQAVNALAGEFGYRPIESTEVETLRGLTTREVLHHLGIPTWRVPKIASRLRAQMFEELGQIQLFDGVAAMLERLTSAGLTVAVISSNSEESILGLLGPHLMPHISYVDAGISMFGKTPRLKKALRRFGLEPSEAIYIGDELRDLTAASKVPMAAGGVVWGYGRRDAIEGASPEIVFYSLDEMATYFLD